MATIAPAEFLTVTIEASGLPSESMHANWAGEPAYLVRTIIVVLCFATVVEGMVLCEERPSRATDRVAYSER